ncbi:helix-turn-helix transcriptional regulator [Nonomuraea sp. NPDC050022]|uniref:helix-turn-helix transcriptional regulator n=1 Tax=Nonomuraea sp. NPDC050022 TaxID=3364358 RepID=UPI00379A9212
MLETSARLLRPLSLLQTPRDWTGTELAERLGVSGRTVRADVERLRTLGYPVPATRGSASGYRLGAGAVLPPLLLDDEEAVAVPSVDASLLTTLSAVCRDRERLRFDYHDHAGAATVRTVEPYRLVNWGRRWYLLAWDVERDDWRTFRVDRIRPRTPTGPRFTPRDLPDDDIAAYVSRRVSAAAWRYRAQVTVHAPAEVIADRISPAVGTVERLDERTCVLHTGTDTIETLGVHLGLLDADFDVTGPPELRTHLRRLADRYLRSTTSSAPGDPTG